MWTTNRREFVLRNNAGRSFERLDFGILKMDDWTGGSIVVMPVNGLPTVMYSSNGLVYSLRFVPAPPAPAKISVVEYFNVSLDHYFVTPLAGEQANLDAGLTPTRWTRTGKAFNAFESAGASTSPVCRFYIPPSLGDSHFFGRGTAECDSTAAKNPSFVLEATAFVHMVLPTGGTCPAGTAPVYRVFSNRGDANHRYMTDRTIRDQMVAKGWLAEGDGPDLVVMCAPQ
jgi:hypothetical protein